MFLWPLQEPRGVVREGRYIRLKIFLMREVNRFFCFSDVKGSSQFSLGIR